MLRRETIIALRARHTAFRIAVDMLYPPQSPPEMPPPLPSVPRMWQSVLSDEQVALIRIRSERQYDQVERRRRRLFVIVLIGIALVPVSLVIHSAFFSAEETPDPSVLPQVIVPP